MCDWLRHVRLAEPILQCKWIDLTRCGPGNEMGLNGFILIILCDRIFCHTPTCRQVLQRKRFHEKSAVVVGGRAIIPACDTCPILPQAGDDLASLSQVATPHPHPQSRHRISIWGSWCWTLKRDCGTCSSMSVSGRVADVHLLSKWETHANIYLPRQL